MNPVEENESQSKLINNLSLNKSIGPCSITTKIKKTLRCFKTTSVLSNKSIFLTKFSSRTPKTCKSNTNIYKERILKFPVNTAQYRYSPFLVNYIKSACIRVYIRLYWSLNYLLERQFGFRNNHSTNHALIDLIDLIKKYTNNDYYVCKIFIDLQKTFDTVNHDILHEKLEYYGIQGLANNCISSFVKNRK